MDGPAVTPEQRRRSRRQNMRARTFLSHMGWTLDAKLTRRLRAQLGDQVENVLPFVALSDRLVRLAVAFPDYVRDGVMVTLACLGYTDGFSAARRAHHECEVRETFEALSARPAPARRCNDHGLDALRYAVVRAPRPSKVKVKKPMPLFGDDNNGGS